MAAAPGAAFSHRSPYLKGFAVISDYSGHDEHKDAHAREPVTPSSPSWEDETEEAEAEQQTGYEQLHALPLEEPPAHWKRVQQVGIGALAAGTLLIFVGLILGAGFQWLSLTALGIGVVLAGLVTFGVGQIGGRQYYG